MSRRVFSKKIEKNSPSHTDILSQSKFLSRMRGGKRGVSTQSIFTVSKHNKRVLSSIHRKMVKLAPETIKPDEKSCKGIIYLVSM